MTRNRFAALILFVLFTTSPVLAGPHGPHDEEETWFQSGSIGLNITPGAVLADHDAGIEAPLGTVVGVTAQVGIKKIGPVTLAAAGSYIGSKIDGAKAGDSHNHEGHNHAEPLDVDGIQYGVDGKYEEMWFGGGITIPLTPHVDDGIHADLSLVGGWFDLDYSRDDEVLGQTHKISYNLSAPFVKAEVHLGGLPWGLHLGADWFRTLGGKLDATSRTPQFDGSFFEMSSSSSATVQRFDFHIERAITKWLLAGVGFHKEDWIDFAAPQANSFLAGPGATARGTSPHIEGIHFVVKATWGGHNHGDDECDEDHDH